jgi:hypothetical protein
MPSCWQLRADFCKSSCGRLPPSNDIHDHREGWFEGDLDRRRDSSLQTRHQAGGALKFALRDSLNARVTGLDIEQPLGQGGRRGALRVLLKRG